MSRYLARRALFALATIAGVSVIIFVVLRVLPGDPLVAILGVEGIARMTPANVKAAAKRYLDPKQYFQAVLMPAATTEPAKAPPVPGAEKP